MKTLNFDFDYGNNPFYKPESVSCEAKNLCKDYYNKIYEKYIDRINACGGKMLIGYPMDGESIINYVLDCPEELYKEIINDEVIIQSLQKNKIFK